MREIKVIYLTIIVKENKMITEQQKQKMQHMLGFSNGKAPKTLWRNYWYGKNEDMEDLVTQKKACKTTSAMCKDPVYFLLPVGIDEIMGKGWSFKHKAELIKHELVAEWAFEETENDVGNK